MRRRPPVFAADRRLVFAHRGGALRAPENTMAAIDNGLALGADGLEIDVQLSADGVPVVIHDRTLDRTTDRTGPVQALTAAELAARRCRLSLQDRRHLSLSWSGHRRADPRRGAGQTRQHPHHHRDERRRAGSGARGGAVGPARRCGRSRLRRLVLPAIHRHPARRTSRDRHQRVAGGSALDAAPVVGALAVRARARLLSHSRSPSTPVACAWCRRTSCATCIAKGTPSRSGSSTIRPRCTACWIGA